MQLSRRRFMARYFPALWRLAAPGRGTPFALAGRACAVWQGAKGQSSNLARVAL